MKTRANKREPSPAQAANRARNAGANASQALAVMEEALPFLDAEARLTIGPVVDALEKRCKATVRALRVANREAAEVRVARRELRAEAEARRARTVGDGEAA